MGYLDRAMRSKNPKYRMILERLGYKTTEMVAEEPVAAPVVYNDVDELTLLREEYEAVFGEKPHPRAKAETLRAKIAEAKG